VSVRGVVVGRRVCALLALCSAALHGVSLGDVTTLVGAMLMVAMVTGCLYCARDLWLRGTVRGWVMVAVMNFAMIAIHMPMAPHHHGGGVAAAGPVHDTTVMTVATAFAALEVSIAATVLYFRTRTSWYLDGRVSS